MVNYFRLVIATLISLLCLIPLDAFGIFELIDFQIHWKTALIIFAFTYLPNLHPLSCTIFFLLLMKSFAINQKSFNAAIPLESSWCCFFLNLSWTCCSHAILYVPGNDFILSDVCISLPTFIIAECVLIYLDPDSSRSIVGWASKAFSSAVFFLYEQVFLLIILTFCDSLIIFLQNCSSQLISLYFVAVFYFVWYPLYKILYFSLDPPRWSIWWADDQKLRGILDYSSLSFVSHYFWTHMSKQILDSLWHFSIWRTEYGFKICIHMKWDFCSASDG